MDRVARIGAGFYGASAVILGAVGAHGVEMTAREQANWELGVQYQLVHAVALLALAALPGAGRLRPLAVGAFLGGILLFCGALYLPPLVGETPLAKVAPWGGTLLIIGWLMLLVEACLCRPKT